MEPGFKPRPESATITGEMSSSSPFWGKRPETADGLVLEGKRVIGGDIQVGPNCVVAAVGGAPERLAEHRRLDGAVFGDIFRLCIGHGGIRANSPP